MPNTYQLISANTLTTSTATVTFSSIPSTFTDLVIKFTARTDASGFTNDQMGLRFNGVNTADYGYTYLYGSGSGSGTTYGPASPETSGYIALINASNATSNVFSNGEVYIPNYTSSTQKPSSAFTGMEHAATAAYVTATANLGTLTTAISSVSFLSRSGANFISGSSFYLYGIKKS
jgi:hypothetical protein